MMTLISLVVCSTDTESIFVHVEVVISLPDSGDVLSSADNFCKQFGPRSGPTESGSKLFDTQIVFRDRIF